MTNQFACPRCQRSLKTAQPMSPGSMVKCPQCAAILRINEAGVAVESAKPSIPASPSSSPIPPKPAAAPPVLAPVSPKANPAPPAKPAVSPPLATAAMSPVAPAAKPAVRPAPASAPPASAAAASAPKPPTPAVVPAAPSPSSATPPSSAGFPQKALAVLRRVAAVSAVVLLVVGRGTFRAARKSYAVSKPVVLAGCRRLAQSSLGQRVAADRRLLWGSISVAGLLLLGTTVLAMTLLAKGLSSWIAPGGGEESLARGTSDSESSDVPEIPCEAPRPKQSARKSGNLEPDVLSKVKRATVYISVKMADGTPGSGSGFFSAEPGVILTNAHVVDMLDPDKPPPKSVEARLYSGTKDEKTFKAGIVAVDRSTDLAVLRLDAPTDDLPEPLAVYSAGDLTETQQVHVIGFPFGNNLGKEISISQSSVSSLRKSKFGDLTQVQVNGGMNPGNSGGPVVDCDGNVVGVSVSVILNTQINFAIPGDQVHRILQGRVLDVQFGQASRREDNVVVPVTVRTLDPLKRIKKIGIDWWVGPRGKDRPPSSTRPDPQNGDAPRRTVYLDYRAGEAQGELVLPPAPSGKVHWLQARCVNGARQSSWGSATAYVPDIADPKPALLAYRHGVGEAQMNLRNREVLKLRADDEDGLDLNVDLEVQLTERTTAVTPEGGALREMKITSAGIDVSEAKRPVQELEDIQRIVKDLSQIVFNVTVDREGIITKKTSNLNRLPMESATAGRKFSDRFFRTLEIASVPLPGTKVNPGHKWTAQCMLPMDATASLLRTLTFNTTYTYRGLRTRDGREEALIDIQGALQKMELRGLSVGGTLKGLAVLDVGRGQITEMRITMDLKLHGAGLRINGTTETHLERIFPEE